MDTETERDGWRQRTRRSLQRLPWVVSGGQPYHVAVIEGRFGKGPQGRTLRDVVRRFWEGREPEQVFLRYH
ncbi:MAG: hypothetical protein KTR31_33735 [Myxococcales bacterium]|nr:hypothetical protein [Myxococcales bacterium]